ncbi:thiamine phosphate synthase [Nitriliruptoraceae bacterium ZYF776]|nr:thiamine phosphate synthase [Profundirhabdus halotolerans]
MTDVPRLLLLTDRHVAGTAGHTLQDAVAAALAGGVRAVLGRDKDLPRATRARLLAPVADRCRDAGARFLVASDPTLAVELGADGLHLAAADPPAPATAPGQLGPLDLVGRSCHDAAELVRARRDGVTYATVSPFAPTATKPGYGPPLGSAGLGRLVAVAGDLPLLALGGIDATNAAAATAAGAHGVAVLGAVLRAHDPTAATAALRVALSDDVHPPEPIP